MTYYRDEWLTVLHGDCREAMRTLEPESVHCVVTSPPYWGLRDYGTASWEGGDEGCDHVAGSARKDATTRNAWQAANGLAKNAAAANDGGTVQYRETCGKCGARRVDNQLGLEATPEEYVANMVAVFREVRRVLRADGTVWLNLGDSYNNAGSSRNGEGLDGKRRGGTSETVSYRARDTRHSLGAIKHKDLVGIPWRVAFALQADGWYLRSDIIWSKPNPMPESVTDRPTKSHEYLFLLAKSARYYYDADAVREPHQWPGGSVVERGVQGFATAKAGPKGQPDRGNSGGFPITTDGRNLRSVWTIATQPYPGAHFATFPRKLVEPCIKAGTSERGVCPECGAPWVRVVERGDLVGVDRGGNYEGREIDRLVKRNPGTPGMAYENRTTGWRATCEHETSGGPCGRCGVLGDYHVDQDHAWSASFVPGDNGAFDPIPATVLDPFAGSGTTGMVAQSLGRRAVLIDLNGEYLTQAMARNRDIPLGLEVA